ncbi:guanylate cyclase [Vibrio sp. SM6]|uniref:Guanylate cyclase n=1 Tax=Vibrio agarilyticus TaxID=2726741 RepID=A0A7X8YGR7_9VIBR|nr:heme NO-binding domain-containing protein [Vibrio agarilyticus]NLS12637.1 guanylate cyclase [Vibrio agarilyticus]
MKGIIFTEFLDLVEEKFGLETLDRVLDLAEDEGIYTSVGSYDHQKLVKLIVQLSRETNISPEVLQEVFGECAFIKLYETLPQKESLQQCGTTLEFIRHVEHYIHVEVKKLYPDANPPKFEFIDETESHLIFDYCSVRCMSHVCFGLIKGCANHYDETVNVEMTPNQDDASRVRFAVSIM